MSIPFELQIYLPPDNLHEQQVGVVNKHQTLHEGAQVLDTVDMAHDNVIDSIVVPAAAPIKAPVR